MSLPSCRIVFAVVALAAPAALADSAPPKKSAPKTERAPDLADAIRKGRPKGWRVSKPPSGVDVLLVGPATKGPAPVISVRAWPRPVARPQTEAGLERLAKRLGYGEGFTSSVAAGALGPRLDVSLGRGMVARHVLRPRGLLTIVAPRALLPAISTWLQRAVRRLPRAS